MIWWSAFVEYVPTSESVLTNTDGRPRRVARTIEQRKLFQQHHLPCS